MSATVTHIHTTRAAKADRVFAQVDFAARRMGYSDSLALRAAQAAKRRFLCGQASPARAIADQRAELRRDATGPCA